MDAFLIIIVILICIGLFFLCRQLNCWYWKINERIDLMNQMLDNQEDIIKLLQGKKLKENEEPTTEVNEVASKSHFPAGGKF